MYPMFVCEDGGWFVTCESVDGLNFVTKQLDLSLLPFAKFLHRDWFLSGDSVASRGGNS